MKPEETRNFVIRDESGKIYPLDKNGSFVLNRETSEIRVLTLASEPSQIPKDFAVQQNYPNPFNPSTSIEFHLPKASIVTLKVYDVIGYEVETLLKNQSLPAGIHATPFSSTGLPSGLYFYKLETNNMTFYRKMLLMK